MVRNLLFVLVLAFMTAAGLHAQTSLEGSVKDAQSGEPIILAYVVLMKGDVEITGTETDFSGNYSLTNLDPGTYDVEVSIVSHQTSRIEGVIIRSGRANLLNVELSSGVDIQEVVVVEYKAPLIDPDENTQGRTITSEDIENLPVKDIGALAATTAGVSKTEGGTINIRGGREEATTYLIDGVRVTGRLVQQTEIEQMEVITGGISAMYGDVTAGIISLTTKGPSNRFGGSIEFETSEYLDGYGYNLVNGALSGPIVKKDNRSIVGFRLGGQYRSRLDGFPRAFGSYHASADAIKMLEEKPLDNFRGLSYAKGEALRSVDAEGIDNRFAAVDLYKARKNIDDKAMDFFAKLDFRLSDAIDLQLTGSYFNSTDRVSPSGWSLVNYQRNPYSLGEGYRLNGRLRYRIGGSGTYGSGDEREANQGFIRNTVVTLQGGYQKSKSSIEDLIHGDNYGRYGYIGKFNSIFEPSIQRVDNVTADTANVEGGTFFPSLFDPEIGTWVKQMGTEEKDDPNGYYEPNYDINPVLVRYNELMGDPSGINSLNVIARNGQILDYARTLWGSYVNVGTVYNSYNKSENDLYSGEFAVSFDLFPGGSERGRHNIQFGGVYEQRVYRNYSVAPNTLWLRAQQLANSRILGVDYDQAPIDSTLITVGESSKYVYIYPNLMHDDGPGEGFFRNIREKLNIGIDEFVSSQSINPDDLTLDLFAPRELTDQGNLGYYGYDYLGNKLEGVSFEDFFVVEQGREEQNFVVAPFRPYYVAGYIQDKFSYKDLIFRAGLRVDFYNANTKVLRNPNTLYQLMTAKEFYGNSTQTQPGNIGDDYLVYVRNSGDNVPYGFRNGDVWYNRQGTQLNDGAQLWGGQPVYGMRMNDVEINDKEFHSSGEFDRTFMDYKVIPNVMPRLAFSFPISDAANFFAHYDILTQRPPMGNSYVSPLSYYYMDQPDRVPLNNPNLRPVKTIDYEVGFQQRLSNTSALKVGAYYKEMRDLIQQRRILYVPGVNRYDTYSNLDFGTVYGFTVSYDLRRTGNFRATINYTLQFADGTGSDADSQAGLLVRGNIRTLFPLNFDERHRIVLNADYRYASGKRYSGPRIGGLDILANTGLNVQFVGVSGRPYSAALGPDRFGSIGTKGSINGARLPWNYLVDAKLDKNIRLTPAEAKKPLYLNVYVRVLNLFDTKNILGVYRYTGSPKDDGYRASSQGVQTIESVLMTRENMDANIDAFTDFYNWRMLNQGFYSLPRRIYVGAIFQF